MNIVSREYEESDSINAPITEKGTLTLIDKLTYQIYLFRFTGPLFLVYFAEYLINQGIFPAVTFPNELRFSTNEYVYYQFLYQIGVFVSRSSVNVVQIKALWFMAFWQCGNLALLWTTAYWNYIPSIYIVFILIFYEGLLGGAVFVNGFFRAAEEIPEEYKEFGMSSISVWYSAGILLSGVAGLFVQPWLQNRREEEYFVLIQANNTTAFDF